MDTQQAQQVDRAEIKALPVPTPRRVSLIEKFAAKFSLEAENLKKILKATAFRLPADRKTGEVIVATDEQMAALLVVADQYNLNPFTKEIYAFPDKSGGIVPVVGVDGWSRIINSHPAFNGMKFDLEMDEATKLPISMTCTIWRKDRQHPVVVTEYYDECNRPAKTGIDGKTGKEWTAAPGPWQTHPKRMMRNKAMIQAGRVGFALVGIYDDDEAARIIDVTPTREPEPSNVVNQLNSDITGKTASEVVRDAEPVTFAQVSAMLVDAESKRDHELLAIARDMVRYVADEAQRAELDTEARRIFAALPQE